MLKNRWWLILVTMGFIFAFIIGMWTRGSFTDYTSTQEGLDNFYVAVWDNEIYPDMEKEMLVNLQEAPIILRVKADGNIKYSFKTIKQHVIVEEIYNGENIQVNDSLYIMGENGMFVFPEMYINMGFVNFLKKDQEYLVFLDRKLISPEQEDDNTYLLAQGDSYILPVFNYNSTDNVTEEPQGEDLYVPYKSVKNNEFFAKNEKTLSDFLNLKQQLVEKYPK